MRTVVIVDDEPIVRMDLSGMLEEIGFQVVGEAGDGFDAVTLCRTHQPNFEVAHRIKRMRDYKSQR